MRDALKLDEVQLIYNGKEVIDTCTYVTENGNIYIGLKVDGCWVNIHSNDVHMHIKDRNNFYETRLTKK